MSWMVWAAGLVMFAGGIVLAGTVSPVLGVPVLVIGGGLLMATKFGGFGGMGTGASGGAD